MLKNLKIQMITRVEILWHRMKVRRTCTQAHIYKVIDNAISNSIPIDSNKKPEAPSHKHYPYSICGVFDVVMQTQIQIPLQGEKTGVRKK